MLAYTGRSYDTKEFLNLKYLAQINNKNAESGAALDSKSSGRNIELFRKTHKALNLLKN